MVMNKKERTSMGSEGNTRDFVGLTGDLGKKFFWIHSAKEKWFELRLEEGKMQEVKSFLQSTAHTLLGDPQGLEVFAEEGSLNPQDIFYKGVSEALQRKIKKDWSKIESFQLASLVKLYSHPISDATRDLAKSLLTNYFRGKQTIEESVTSRYNFVSGILDLDLEGDVGAVESGIRIVDFVTDILPVTSKVYKDCSIATFAIYNNDRLLQKAIITSDILRRYLREKYKFIFQPTDEQQNNFILATRKALMVGQKSGERTAKKLGRDAVLQKRDTLAAYYDQEIPLDYYISPPQDPKEMSWPCNLALNTDDPLIQKLIKVLSSNR